MTNYRDFGNIENSFRQAMADAGLRFDGEILADGALHRFKVEGDHGPHGWYVLHPDGVPVGVYGCHKRDLEGTWCAKPEKELTKVEKTAYRKQVADAKVKRDAEQARRYAESAAQAQAILDAAQPADDDHPYLTRKLVSAYLGARVGDWPQRQAKNCLLIPFAIDGRLSTIQAIAASGLLVANSSKDWLIGGRKSGASFQIGDPENSESIVFSEGYSTSASIHQATGYPVVVCGDAGNLLAVAKTYRAKFATKRLLIAADNDVGKDTNTGLKAAKNASQAVLGLLVFPDFTDAEVASWQQCHDGKTPSDFNDLRIIRGLDGVRVVFNTAMDSNETTAPSKDSLLVKTDKKGNSSLIQHNEAAEILYREEFNSLLYYHAVTCYWYQYQPTGIFAIRPELAIQHSVYSAINRHCGDLGFSASYVSGVAKCLMFESVREPQTPKGKVCFLNGVLELESRELLEHKPSYFFTSQLPFEWQPSAPDPQPVIDWLTDSVGGKPDQVQLIRAYANAIILGRSNLQRFLELIGPGGSGKSTLIRLFVAMIGNEAVYSTQLKQLEENRFETAKIFGKKLVVVTDAEKWHSDVSTLKCITGEDTIRFEEKNKQSDISFIYRGMVVIAANQHTGSNDYSSAIQRRRITVEFDHVVSADKRRDLDSEFEPLLPSVVRWVLDMPNAEVVSYLRNTSSRVKSLQSVRLETLTATNPIAAWLMDCVSFNESSETQVGTKERITKTSGCRDEDKTTRHEYEHWQTRLYPSYLAWCDRSNKQAISLQVFARTVVDCCKNMLGKPFVKKSRQSQGAVIKGVSLCRLNADSSVIYPIENDENVDCADLKESLNCEEGQAETSDEFGVNLGINGATLHGQHFDKNQDVKQHEGLHKVNTVQTDDDWERI